MIHFRCACGRGFRAPDGFAGKQTRCVACGAALRVPVADPEGTTLHAGGPGTATTVVAVPAAAPPSATAGRAARVFWPVAVLAASLLSCLCGGGLTAVMMSQDTRPPATRAAGGKRTIGDLVRHLKESGVEGTYFRQPDDPFGIGGEDGGSYLGGGVEVIIREFTDVSRATSLEKSGFNGATCHRFDGLIVVVLKDEQRILPVLKRF